MCTIDEVMSMFIKNKVTLSSDSREHSVSGGHPQSEMPLENTFSSVCLLPCATLKILFVTTVSLYVCLSGSLYAVGVTG